MKNDGDLDLIAPENFGEKSKNLEIRGFKTQQEIEKFDQTVKFDIDDFQNLNSHEILLLENEKIIKSSQNIKNTKLDANSLLDKFSSDQLRKTKHKYSAQSVNQNEFSNPNNIHDFNYENDNLPEINEQVFSTAHMQVPLQPMKQATSQSPLEHNFLNFQSSTKPYNEPTRFQN